MINGEEGIRALLGQGQLTMEDVERFLVVTWRKIVLRSTIRLLLG